MGSIVRPDQWRIGTLVLAILGVQSAVWFLLALDIRGVGIPFVREIVAFGYLTFVPGVLILRTLKLQALDSTQTLLYSTGLSLATLMFAGLVANSFLPLLGVAKPLAASILLPILTALVLGLCGGAYVRDHHFDPGHSSPGNGFLFPVVLLCLLPVLSIGGVYLQNVYHSNILLMLLIVVIAVVVVLAGSARIIPIRLYPLVVFAVSLALLFHRSLISEYLAGFDIHEEYHYANLVRLSGVWNPAIRHATNPLLSIVVLAPIASIISRLSLDGVLKIFYPLWFAFASVGLYRIFQRQTGEKIGFLSSFFFIAFIQFYSDLPVMPRQLIAMLFLVALIMLKIDVNIEIRTKVFLFVVFGASLIVSHHGLSYAYIIFLVLSCLIQWIRSQRRIEGLRARIRLWVRRYGGSDHPGPEGQHAAVDHRPISPVFVALFIVMALAWYLHTADAWGFDTFVRIGSGIIHNFSTALFDPRYSHALSLLLAPPKPGMLGLVGKIMDYVNQLFIIVGVLALLLGYERRNFEQTFAVGAVISLGLLSAAVIMPFLTVAVNTERLYHLTLIFLAPFGVLGGLIVFRRIVRPVKWRRVAGAATPATALLVYFVAYFLFQSGLISQLTIGYSGSFAISQGGIRRLGRSEERAALYTAITPKQEVLSAMWLARGREPGEKVYATYRDIRVHALTSYGMIPVGDVPPLTRATSVIPDDAYVYLQYLNVVEGLAAEPNRSPLFGQEYTVYEMRKLLTLFVNKNKIYDNGGSEIYR